MNQKYVCLVEKINFIIFENQDDYPDESVSKIREDCFIVIDFYSIADEKFIIICFDEQLIIIDQIKQAGQTFFNEILNRFTNKSQIFFLKGSPKGFVPIIQNFDFFSKSNKIFNQEIEKFTSCFQLFPQQDSLHYIFKIIKPCLSGYLIKKKLF